MLRRWFAIVRRFRDGSGARIDLAESDRIQIKLGIAAFLVALGSLLLSLSAGRGENKLWHDRPTTIVFALGIAFVVLGAYALVHLSYLGSQPQRDRTARERPALITPLPAPARQHRLTSQTLGRMEKSSRTFSDGAIPEPADTRPGEIRGRARLEEELDAARLKGASPWWDPQGASWYGDVFLFWSKAGLAIPSDEIALRYEPIRYDARSFGLPEHVDAPRDKAILLGATSLLSDDPQKSLRVASTNWGVVQWAERNAATVMSAREVSVFGIEGTAPFPSLISAQVVVTTADGWLVLSLRSRYVDYYPGTWSATLTESVEAGSPRDASLLSVARRGIEQEIGPRASSHIDFHTCLGIGREYAPESQGRLVLNATVPVGCRLSCTLEDVWDALDDGDYVRDREEHSAWVAIRSYAPTTRTFLDRSLRGGFSLVDLLDAFGRDNVAVCKRSGDLDPNVRFEWAPPSPAALYLTTKNRELTG